MRDLKMLVFVLLLVALAMPLCGRAQETAKEPTAETKAALDRLNEEGLKAAYASDYPTALEKWQTGLEQARALNDKRYISKFLGNLGIVHLNLRQYPRALEYFEQVLAIKRAIGDRREEGGTLTNLGLVYSALGQYQKALESYEQALAIHREIGNRDWEGNALGGLGDVYQKLGRYQEALNSYEQALMIFREIGDRRREGGDLTNLGRVYQKLRQYARALESYEQALAIQREIGDRAGEGADLTNIGIVCTNLGQYQKALEYYEQALAIKRELGDRRGEGGDLTNIGLGYSSLGQYQQALGYHEQALAIHREIGNRDWEGNALGGLGDVYNNLGQYQRALEYYEQALVIKRALGDRAGEGGALTGLGGVYANLGQYQKALEYYEQALAIKRAIGDRRGEGGELTNIGLVYTNLGQYQQALEYSEQALAITRALGDRVGEGNVLTNLGIVYQHLSQYQRALEYYEQALAIRREIGDRRGEGGDLTNIGVLYSDLCQYQRALEYYEQALVIHREIGNRDWEGNALGNIGIVYQKLGQYQEALKYYEQVLAIHHEIGDRHGEGGALSNIGLVYTNLGQYQEAYTTLQNSIDIHTAIGNREFLWRGQHGLASVEVKLNQPESAIIHYEEALDTIESLRAGLKEKEQKFSFMQGKLYVYDELINLLQDLHKQHHDKGYDRKALEIFERKQGRVFLEEMGQSGARNFTGIPAELLEKELDLENQLEQTRKQLSDQRAKIITERNKDLIKDLEEREKTLLSEQTSLQAQIKTDYPDYYALKYPKPVALADLQTNVLQPGELILVYGVMEEKTCLWVVGKEAFGLYPIAIGEEALAAKIETFRNAVTAAILEAITRQEPINRLRRIAKRSMAEIQQTSHDLSDMLLPVEARPVIAEAENLYIVPTGALYGLPFEVLQIGGDPTQVVPYLIEDHAIAYLSSASLLKILRDMQSRKKTEAMYPLLAFANPVYTLAKVSEPSQGFTSRGMQTRAYLHLMGGSFSELPETEKEVKEVKDILQAPDASQPLQLRENASRSKVFQLHKNERLDDYRYVVFACHGILPGEINQVTQPALVLSLPDPVTQQEDYLTMSDIFGLQFNAELITLSACNTGRGQQVTGEGVMGLTRAFMYAGTPAISITLWSVESQSAKTLSTGLYRYLKEGNSCAAALREIKLKMLHGEEGSLYQHPFFWAPVVLFGDGG